ncbi:GNAT family N-acetyltransferase [Algoriphagus terrigena]|uniref:GNAT family N-acetyltransferase n=1 Tax=Algoriphagus terrigena TaxID=344884 RepID=UPI0004067DBA|nr:GNAT family N-acetyltransferase [Algoriphagus terrigena]
MKPIPSPNSPVLDNPIWNALITGSSDHALGNDRVRYMQRDKGLFVGFETYSAAEWLDLDGWFPPHSQIILFTAQEIPIPSTWKIHAHRPLLQMVYETIDAPAPGKGPRAVPLADKDIPAMLDLTARTNPGPFFSKTIDLGYYEGVFEEDRLVAMTGQRLRPDPYVEVSAVCTDPDFAGKGLAAELVANQVNCILTESKIPFLHVNTTNLGAIKLYEKVGFRVRREIWVYFLEKI